MPEEDFSRKFGSEGVWRNYPYLGCLELVFEEVAQNEGYEIRRNGKPYESELSWDIPVEGQTYNLRKTTKSEGDDYKYYPTLDEEWVFFELEKRGELCLQVRTHISFGSNYDGSIEWVDSFEVEGSLFEGYPFARLMYRRIVKHYDEFDPSK